MQPMATAAKKDLPGRLPTNAIGGSEQKNSTPVWREWSAGGATSKRDFPS